MIITICGIVFFVFAYLIHSLLFEEPLYFPHWIYSLDFFDFKGVRDCFAIDKYCFAERARWRCIVNCRYLSIFTWMNWCPAPLLTGFNWLKKCSWLLCNSATVHPQDVITSDKSNGSLPVYLNTNRHFALLLMSIVLKSCNLFKKLMAGCACIARSDIIEKIVTTTSIRMENWII